MKKEGSLKLILSILIIVLLILVSVGGIYVKDKNIMKNILPDYILGMDLDTNTIVKLDVVKDEQKSSENTQENDSNDANKEDSNSTNQNTEGTQNNETNENTNDVNTSYNETNTNNENNNVANNESNSTQNNETNQNTENKSDDSSKEEQVENIYTLDNYKKCKKIIEKRLNANGVQQYTIRLDETSGSIVIEVPNDIDSSTLQNSFVVGKTELKIKETGEVIGDYNSINKFEIDSNSNYFTLSLSFKNNAKDKFKEIKNNYVIPTDEEGKQKDNTVAISIDGSELFTWEESKFLEQAVNGSAVLSYYNEEYRKDIQKEIDGFNCFLKYGELPVKYKVEYTNDVHSNVSKLGIISVFAVLGVVMLIYLLIKYGLKGLVSWLTILGFESTLLLLIRFTKVPISIASIVALAIIAILQFAYLIKLLNNKNIHSKVFNNATLDFSKILIPIFIMSVVIIFTNIIEISGFGMIIFWGLILFEIFNNIITRAILTNVKNK